MNLVSGGFENDYQVDPLILGHIHLLALPR